MRRFPFRLLALLVVLTLAALVTACGDDVTGAEAGGPATTADDAERIVSLSPTATEILFALGAGDAVVAVDDQSTFPPEAPVTELSGLQPNTEAIAAYDPELVVLMFDPGDLVAALDALDIPTLVHPAAASLDDAYAQILELGEASGTTDAAEDLVATMRTDLAALADSVTVEPGSLTYYHEIDDTYFTATSATFIGEVYGLLGLENIADEADVDGSGFPQLSAEFIIESDPDLIFLADTISSGQDASTVAARPGWDQLSAVQQGAVVELDDDVASRWGPRIVDLLAEVTAAVNELR